MPIDDLERDVLHSLAYLYLLHGQHSRGLTLVALASKSAPNDRALLMTYAYALILNREGAQALDVLQHLVDLSPDKPTPTFKLLRSRALLLDGRIGEARQAFRDFVLTRRDADGDHAS